MFKQITLLSTCLAFQAIECSSGIPAVATRKRALIDELQEKINRPPSSSKALQLGSVTPQPTAKKRTMVPPTEKPAAQPHIPAPTVPTVSTSSTKPARIKDAQELFASDIAILLETLSSSISSETAISDETKKRLTLYIASTVAQEEKRRKELENFTTQLSIILRQLDQLNRVISTAPTQFRTVRLAPGTHLCCGKELFLVLDLLNEVEKAIRARHWGRYIDLGAPSLERTSDYVNEDAIAGSWIVFLDARLSELESTRGMQTNLNHAKTEKILSILTNKILQLRELCQFLRQAALDKKINADYREAAEELFNPATGQFTATTASTADTHTSSRI